MAQQFLPRGGGFSKIFLGANPLLLMRMSLATFTNYIFWKFEVSTQVCSFVGQSIFGVIAYYYLNHRLYFECFPSQNKPGCFVFTIGIQQFYAQGIINSNNILVKEFTVKKTILQNDRYCALGKHALKKVRFYFSHCEISNMMDMTAFYALDLLHTILSEIHPPTYRAHPSLLMEPGKQTPLSSSSSDSCHKVMEQFKTFLRSQNMQKTFLFLTWNILQYLALV